MRRLRIAILILLVAAPILFQIGMGWYALWSLGWTYWAWWPMAGSFALASFLGLYWYRKHGLIRPMDFTAPAHATDRDKEAWKLIEARARDTNKLQPEQLTLPQFYLDTAENLALELAQFYHPKATNPVGSLTIVEILAVIELAAHDLANLIDEYVPAGHLVTIDQWRQAKRASDWYKSATKLWWLASVLWSPLEGGTRFAASEAGIRRPWEMIQENLLVWFYTAFLNRLGHYLIELHSGRLRVGASRYRQLTAVVSPDAPREAGVGQITVTLLGQVKAGKSSLVNALLGQQRAHTNVLPETDAITRYEMTLEDIPTRFVLLDTPGYNHEGPRADQLKATVEAARRSNLLLLVLHARNAARQADLEALQALERWFSEHPDLKMPPIIAVLTHIDLLSPMMEWAPPYDWEEPERPKEKQIAEAVATAQETLGGRVNYIAPVCTAEGKVYGIEDWLLPALVSQLDEAHGVELVRCLRAEADAGKVQKVFQQLYAVGKHAVSVVQERYRK